MWPIIVLLMLFSAVGYFIVKWHVMDWWHRRVYGHSLMMKPPPAKHDWSKRDQKS